MKLLLIAAVVLLMTAVNSFQLISTGTSIVHLKASRLRLKMEYIPDGLTKAQWAKIKKQEEEAKKARGDMAIMGTGKFKSRSMEAWQKAGAKHLFPVNPNEVPYEERPYMQRKNGDWEGSDLKTQGLQAKGQGVGSKRLVVDDVYEIAKKAGKLNSASIFGGKNLPWTSEAANAINDSGPNSDLIQKQKAAVAAKKVSDDEMKRLKANLFKPIVTEKVPVDAGEQQKPAKKFFGLF